MMTPLSIPFPQPRIDHQSWVQKLAPEVDWVSLRFISENTHVRSFRNARPEAQNVTFDTGVMVEVLVNGHFGYSGTSDLSPEGIRRAMTTAKLLAQAGSRNKVHSFTIDQRPSSQGQYRSPVFQSLDSTSLAELNDTLRLACEALKASDKIVSTQAQARIVETNQHIVSSSGADIQQNFLMIASSFGANAQDGSHTQYRSDNGGLARCVQAGLEVFDREEVLRRCTQIGREALELLSAPNCPSETMDLILAPDQMLMQIHESIGHPLELDRILGDERNFAGWSFVQPQDFGKLQYGSSLMNVTFDPGVPGEFASYSFDECGNPAKKEYLIQNGKLLRGLGSLESQTRLGVPGVANFRSASWNRAPIDRMANINLEPGSSSLAEMISQVERGIYMQSNKSWSIDDYRNKFQFGCEFGQLIENGKLTKVVRNPNYRGVTVPFWKSLVSVGSGEEVELYGSPYCGKGEPSQIIRVGHAAPPCLFEDVAVFGGAE